MSTSYVQRCLNKYNNLGKVILENRSIISQRKISRLRWRKDKEKIKNNNFSPDKSKWVKKEIKWKLDFKEYKEKTKNKWLSNS